MKELKVQNETLSFRQSVHMHVHVYLLHKLCVLFFPIVVLFQASEHLLQQLTDTENRPQHIQLSAKKIYNSSASSATTH